MTSRQDQAAIVIDCLRRRGIWVSLRCGQLDMIPPPGKRWTRRIRELCESVRCLDGAIREVLWWEQVDEAKQHILKVKSTPTKDAP